MQAGSDSLLTSSTFLKLTRTCFDGVAGMEKHMGVLYGLGSGEQPCCWLATVYRGDCWLGFTLTQCCANAMLLDLRPPCADRAGHVVQMATTRSPSTNEGRSQRRDVWSLQSLPAKCGL